MWYENLLHAQSIVLDTLKVISCNHANQLLFECYLLHVGSGNNGEFLLKCSHAHVYSLYLFHTWYPNLMIMWLDKVLDFVLLNVNTICVVLNWIEGHKLPTNILMVKLGSHEKS